MCILQEDVWAANQWEEELTNALEECQDMVETLQQFSHDQGRDLAAAHSQLQVRLQKQNYRCQDMVETLQLFSHGQGRDLAAFACSQLQMCLHSRRRVWHALQSSMARSHSGGEFSQAVRLAAQALGQCSQRAGRCTHRVVGLAAALSLSLRPH